MITFNFYFSHPILIRFSYLVQECSTISNPNKDLIEASKSGNTSLVQILLQCNETDINTADSDETFLGYTPLIWASATGHADVVELLLNNHLLDVNKLSQTRDDGNALMVAASKGDTQILGFLLGHNKININLGDAAEGRTALHYATSSGYSTIIQQLLMVPEIDINKANSVGETALMIGSFKGNREIVYILLSHGDVDVNIADTTSGKTALYRASEKGHSDIVNLLLSKPTIDINKEEAGLGQTPLMIAVRKGYEDIVHQFLKMKKIDVNKPTINRETPLMIATNESYYNIIKKLLSFATVEVNFATYEGKTALRIATDSIEATLKYIEDDILDAFDVPLENKTSILELILRCPSTDINILDKEYKTPLDYASEKNTTEIIRAFEMRGINMIKNGHTCCSDEVNDGLQKAAEHGDLTMTISFLRCHQVDLNQGYMYGMTPLFVASRNNHGNVVKILLNDARTDVNKVVNSVNALWEASDTGNTQIVGLLIKHPQIDINQMNTRNKKTPFIVASEKGHEDIVKLLLGHTQIEVNRKDSYGDSALQKASWRAYLGIVKLLLRCSATKVSEEYREQLRGDGKKDIIEAIDWFSTLSKMNATCCLNVKEDLLKASTHGDFRAIRGLLLCPHSDINILDGRGHTPLYLSAWKGHEKAVDVLLANSDIDINKGAPATGQTAFSIASKKGHIEIMQTLIKDNRTNVHAGWCESKWAMYKQTCNLINTFAPTAKPTTISGLGRDVVI